MGGNHGRESWKGILSVNLIRKSSHAHCKDKVGFNGLESQVAGREGTAL